MSDAPDATAGRVSRLLKMAVVGGVEAAVRLHIERGDDLNARDERGFTPLMLAAAKNRSGVCRLLIDAGADADAVNSAGQDARAIAVLMGAAESMAEIDLALARRAERHADDPLAAIVQPGALAAEGDAASALAEEPPGVAPAGGLIAPSLSGGVIAGTAEGEATFDVVGLAAPREMDGLPLVLGAWEAEEDAPPPSADDALFEAPTAIQSLITGHESVDDSADWSDFDAFLPDDAAPFPRIEDAETKARLRALLLRALREGSIPEMAIEELCRGGADPGAAESLARLRFVLEDLGAETDERFEYRSADDDFEVYAAPETVDEEEEIDDALAFLDDLEARRNDPMRLFMREAQRHGLIDAQREVALAKEMESAADRAINCLSSWIEGQRALLVAIDQAAFDHRPLSAITTGAPSHDAPEGGPDSRFDEGESSDMDAEPAEVAASELHSAGRHDLGGGSGLQRHAGEKQFVEMVDELRALVANAACGVQVWEVLREMFIARAFLLQLGDAASKDPSDAAREYQSAAEALATARERMVAANIKLVISIARRYMGSGVPMDDLIQEGNIGLLKAVDKFDWRRGFKFSTMAIWWIRQAISRSVADSAYAIRLPAHCREDVLLISREMRALDVASADHPAPGDIASRVGMKTSKVASLMRAMSDPLSIEQLDAEWEERGEAAPDPFADLDVKQMQARLATVLDRLEERQAEVMRLRAGIGTDDPRTLEEVGQRYGLTRERIRQIEAKALKRLIHPTQRAEFDPWFAKEPKREPMLREHPRLRPTPLLSEPPIGPDGGGPAAAGPSAELPAPALDEARSETAALDDLLDQARELGLEVLDSRLGISQATWVHMAEPVDDSLRALRQGLVAFGFQHWPGRGYWL